MKKYIFCISCYCDTEEKEMLLENQIKYIKSMGYDTCIISPLPFSNKVQELSDYSFVTAQNQILKWPNKGVNFWYSISHNKKKYTMYNVIDDYGWAALSHILQTGNLMKNYGYDDFIFTAYDSKYDESHIQEIDDIENNLFFPTSDGKTNYPIGFHLLYLNKDSFDVLVKNVNFHDYQNTDYLIYDYVQTNVVDKFNFNISKNYAIDLIQLYKGRDFWSHSDDKNELNYFIGTHKTIKILFYKNLTKKPIEVELNGQIIFKGDLDEVTFIDTETPLNEIDIIKIIFDGKDIDITSKINSLNVTNIRI